MTIDLDLDLDRADRPPFALLGDDITLTAVWHGSRWAWWKASLTYTSFNPHGSGFGACGALHGSLLADQHTDPGTALDALRAAADVLGIAFYGPPTLYLHAYSTDGTPVRYPRGAALVHTQAARLGWQAGGCPRPARRA